MAEPSTVRLVLNGEDRTFTVAPGRRLLDLIRVEAGLTGTKEGCGAGECGACAVLVDGLPATSCLVPAAGCDGRAVTTVEGLGTWGTLHPFQRALVDRGGVQCGFCTPGVAVVGAAALALGPLNDAERGRLLSGNLCRCTGYAKIVAALADAGKADHD